MTMTRTAKREHTEQLIAAATTGYTQTRFASPKLARAAKANRGHDRMTGAEYAEHRMHRAGMPECRLELTIQTRARLHRQSLRRIIPR